MAISLFREKKPVVKWQTRTSPIIEDGKVTGCMMWIPSVQTEQAAPKDNRPPCNDLRREIVDTKKVKRIMKNRLAADQVSNGTLSRLLKLFGI